MNLCTIDSDVGLLIGVNVPKAMELWELISSVDEGPFAVKTVLGEVINFALDIRSNSYTCPITIQPQVIDYVQESLMDDEKFLEFVTNFVFFDNGHYVIGLPFKSESVAKPNNWKQTEQRLNSLCEILKGTVSSITVTMLLMVQLLVSDMRKEDLHSTCAKTTDMCGTFDTTRFHPKKTHYHLCLIMQLGSRRLKNTYYRILT